MATTVRLDDELECRIKQIAADTGRSQSFYINQMSEDSIDRMQQIYGILRETEQYQAGNLETYSSDDEVATGDPQRFRRQPARRRLLETFRRAYALMVRL